MKRLPVVVALLAALVVASLVAIFVWRAQEPAAIGPASDAGTVNPACLTARNVTDTFQPEPNRAEALAARRLAGNDAPQNFLYPVVRRQYAQAFALLQKIDDEGTDALIALPPSTPRIDLVIDLHLANLVWARSMLGIFYEQGRVTGRSDPTQAAAFFQKAIDTKYSDDRGCVHSFPISDSIRRHYVAVLVYDMPTPENHAKAMSLLEEGGPKFASDLYLLGKNLLPMERYQYFTENLDDMAEGYRNAPPEPAFSWLWGGSMDDDAIIGLLGRILLWCAVVAALFVGGVGLFRYIRRRQGHKDETSIYRMLFAVYDVLHNVVARFGLVAEGLIGCFVGLSILFGGLAFGGLSSPYNLMIVFGGVSALLGGIAKLIAAARISMTPRNTQVHGSARPAAEPEAQAAARGIAKAPDLGNRTFSE